MLKQFNKWFFLTVLLLSYGALAVGQTETSQQSDVTQQKNKPEVKTQILSLNKGQILTVVLPVIKQGGEQVVREYSSKAFPLARQFGLKSLFNLKVKEATVSKISPTAFSLFSWPDRMQENAFLAHPDWAEIKALRPDGWQHLNVFNTELNEDISLEFSSEYHYTAVIAWFDPENPGDYLEYLASIESALNDVGGKFILKLQEPTFETHSLDIYGPQPKKPGQITFVQWPDSEGFKRLQAHPGYKAHAHLFRSGLKSFEFYGLGVM